MLLSSVVSLERVRAQTALADLPRFEPFLKQQVTNARSALPQREITADGIMASDTTMPP